MAIVKTTFKSWQNISYNAIVYTPDNAGSRKFPCLIFFPGHGEVGTNIDKLFVYSPLGFANKGWKPNMVLIAAQPQYTYAGPPLSQGAIAFAKAMANVDADNIFLTGLSGGAYVLLEYLRACPTDKFIPVKGIIPMSYTASTPFLNARTGSLPGLYFGQKGDAHGDVLKQFYDNLSRAYPSPPKYFYYFLPENAHCCWDKVYDPTYKVRMPTIAQNVSIYEWIEKTAGYGNQAPEVKAGIDLTVQLPASKVHLQGYGGDPDGDLVTYGWKQLTGPNVSTIARINDSVAEASGLVEGEYEFEVTASDPKGLSAKDTVKVTVLKALPERKTVFWAIGTTTYVQAELLKQDDGNWKIVEIAPIPEDAVI